jgi:peptide deformylase
MITTDVDELRKPNEDASPEEVKECVFQLEKVLENEAPGGVGLAAPQIGIHKRIAILRTGRGDLDLVNPRILDRGKMLLSEGESCLSFPGIHKNIWRYGEIVVADDLHPHGLVLTGFMAIVAQHEMDHLDGILIIDRAVDSGIGRNDPCPCGATNAEGRPVKFKKCHGRR